MKTIKKPIKKAQNGTVKYSDPTVEFEKIKKSKDSIYKANFDLNNKKREQEKYYKIKRDSLNKKLQKKQTGGPITLGSVKRNLLDPSIGQKVVNENPRQQKRLNRIKQTNPERASRVENRMVKRANRAMGARGAASRMKKGGSVKKK